MESEVESGGEVCVVVVVSGGVGVVSSGVGVGRMGRCV